MRLVRTGLAIGAIGVGVIVCLVALGIGLYVYATQPLEQGIRIGGGSITTVVTGHFGPVAIAAYVFELGDGRVGLIDAGMDPDATAIRTALAGLGKRDADLAAIFLTHGHDDHAGGTAAFPNAEVYAMEPDSDFVRRYRQRASAAVSVPGRMTRELRDGESVDLPGARVEVYALPGHTGGSTAFLVHGVLFLGDAAQGMRDGTLGANRVLSDDPVTNDRSLKMLAGRLMTRRSEISHLAFGHSGPLEDLDPLLDWASPAP